MKECKTMASIQKLSKGNYRYRISYKVNGKYKIISKSGFSNQKMANIAAAEIEKKLFQGHDISAGNRNIVEAFQEWFEVYKKGKRTIENDKHYFYAIKFSEKYFRETLLKDLTKELYQSALNDFGITHHKETTRKRHTYFRAFIREMFEEGKIPRDPTARIELTGRENENDTLKCLTEKETIKLLKAVNKNLTPRYKSRYLIKFAIATGCRFSEILGLTWDCVNLKDKTVKINKTWDYINHSGFKKTKNISSNRTITIDDNTMLWLSEMKKKRIVDIQGNNLVFTDNGVKPITNNAVNKCLRDICKKENITIITCHGLRHTHATLLLYNDCNIKYVSKRLGHETIVTTLQTYAHVMDEMEQKEYTKVNEFMKKII